MKTIKLTKAIEHEGLAEGDVISVDERSAAKLIERKDAEAYEPEEGTAEAEPVLTIDDIVDPEVARNKRVMTATVVGAADAGPVRRSPDADPADAPEALDADTSDVTVKATQKSSKRGGPSTGNSGTTSTSPEQAASGAQPDGGDAGGGDGS